MSGNRLCLLAVCVFAISSIVASADVLIGTDEYGGVLTLDPVSGKVEHITKGTGSYLNVQSKSAVDTKRGILWHMGASMNATNRREFHNFSFCLLLHHWRVGCEIIKSLVSVLCITRTLVSYVVKFFSLSMYPF